MLYYIKNASLKQHSTNLLGIIYKLCSRSFTSNSSPSNRIFHADISEQNFEAVVTHLLTLENMTCCLQSINVYLSHF